MSASDESIHVWTAVTTATVTIILLKKGVRNVWIRGAFPLEPGTTRVAGRAFTVRFIPAREDLATPASWSSPKSTRQNRRSVAIAASPTTAIAAPARERVVVATMGVGNVTQEVPRVLECRP